MCDQWEPCRSNRRRRQDPNLSIWGFLARRTGNNNQQEEPEGELILHKAEEEEEIHVKSEPEAEF